MSEINKLIQFKLSTYYTQTSNDISIMMIVFCLIYVCSKKY